MRMPIVLLLTATMFSTDPLFGQEIAAPLPAAEHVVADRGMVVSVSPPASDIGLAILKDKGGNAVDGAVATALALAVTWPEAGNLGGGGFMMVWPGKDARPQCVEYRETAPQAATPDMFAKDARLHTHRIVGTPGTVRGLAMAHKMYGKLPWRDLVEPAAKLARDGFEVDAALARSLNGVLKTSPEKEFPEMRRVFAPPEGRAEWKAGDRLVQKDLAKTLDLLASEGPDAFYKGAIAEQIVAEMKAGGGLITAADLAAYEAKLRAPIRGTYRDCVIFGPPPPSSGGIALVEMLNILEALELKRPPADGPAWTAESMHLVIEAMRRAYRDRAEHLGDGDFVKIPSYLTDKDYARQLAGKIDREKATKSETLAGNIALAAESESTTHFSVVDASGMAVSNTYTLEHSFGARIVVRGAGFLLNNEMGDFNKTPGRTDRKGAIGTPANVIAPGKRMLSSQCPTFVFNVKDGSLLVTGSPGGRTIINTVLCNVLQVAHFGRPVEQAVSAPRFHMQWFPDAVRFEGLADPAYAREIEKLKAMGHTFDPRAARQGDAHSIWIDPATGKRHGAADRRLDGKAAGY
jgi:gamma-glutamyltranspeptidase / glutathione hydrolase